MRARTLAIAACFLLAAGRAMAVTPETSPLNTHPLYEKVQSLIRAGAYADALPLLNSLRAEHRDAPDVYNWLGYVHRKLHDYPAARRYYDRALALDPDHLGANEYLGEWFVEMGELSAAQDRLSRLRGLCGDCEEAQDLAQAIAKAQSRHP